MLDDSKLLEQVFATLKPGGFLLTREKLNIESSTDSVDVCLDASLEQERLLLVRKVWECELVFSMFRRSIPIKLFNVSL